MTYILQDGNSYSKVIDSEDKEVTGYYYTFTASGTYTIQEDGEYTIAIIGGGNGGASRTNDDGDSGIPTISCSGSSGGYFEGIFDLKKDDVLSFTLGTGGVGRTAITYGNVVADAGTPSYLYINETLIVECNSARASRLSEEPVNSTATVYSSDKIIQIINTQGIAGVRQYGPEYYPPNIPRTFSPLTGTRDGYGSGGSGSYPTTAIINGYDGAMTLKKLPKYRDSYIIEYNL